MKKPPSLLRKFVREVQLNLSAGVLLLILYSTVTAEIAFRLELPPMSGVAVALAQLVLFRGVMFLAAPALSYGGAYAFELNPYAMGIGPILFVEAALAYMMWTNGRFDEGTDSLRSYFPLWTGSVIIAVVSIVAGRRGRDARLREDRTKAPAPRPVLADATPEAVVQARSFEEQMREAAAQARAPAAAPAAPPDESAAPVAATPVEAPAAPLAPPPETPADKPPEAPADKPATPG